MNDHRSQEAAIIGYLSNELDEGGRLALESWLAESDEHRRIFQEAKALWKNSGKKLVLHNPDTETELARLLERIKKDKTARAKNYAFLDPALLLKVAACILIVVLSVYGYFTLKPAIEFERVTGDQVASFYLPDSSRVWLNTHSRLSYTKEFHGALRRVTLEGEGYFKVTPDASHPFEVVTGATTTRVLGTSFNVKAEDTLTTLSVTEGKVKFSATGEPESEVLVTTHEHATFSTRQKTVTKAGATDMGFASWRKKNNPVYEEETRDIKTFLHHQHTWKKNPIRQSVINGRIRNTASLATYKNVVLLVTYGKSADATRVTRYTIVEPIKPGQEVTYQRRLVDTFTDTSFVRIVVESAEVVLDDAR
ncbi:MAG TPA: FecR domain-containing protein [Chryseolinea sp.]